MGGDGTVHEAINGWWRAGASGPVGVIPAGSGNDAARNTGLPLDPEEAARRLAGGALQPTDLGLLSWRDATGRPLQRVFLNSCSIGVSVHANRIASQFGMIPRGRTRYAAAALRALLAARPSGLRVEDATGELGGGEALNLTVANGAGFGGGMPISPGSSPRDGTLELVLLAPMPLPRLGLALWRLQRGHHLAMREVTQRPLSGAVRITPEAPDWVVETDGQEQSGSGPLTIEALPGRLSLLD